MNKFTSILAGASMLVIAGGVSAEPMTLTADQMDGVSAGALLLPTAVGVAEAAGGTISTVLGATASTATTVVNTVGLASSLSQSGNTSAALSAFVPGLNGPGAVAASASVATSAVD